MKKKKATLPQEVETYLDNSLLFNKFGLVNIKVAQTHTKEKISDGELKKLIQKRFGSEMVNGKVEFV